MEYNFNNDTIRWQMSKSKKDSHVFLHSLLQLLRFLPAKKQVKVTECNFRKYTIQWQVSKSTNISHTFLH